MMYMPGFGGGEGSPELNASPALVKRIVAQMRLFREACGVRPPHAPLSPSRVCFCPCVAA